MTNELSKCTDEMLVQLYAEGNDNAFDVLLMRYKRKVFSYIMTKVKDEDLANDIFQDTFIKAITTIKGKGYSEMGKFAQWIIRIARNLTIDYFRRSSAENEVPGEQQNENGQSIFELLPVYDVSVEDEMVEKQMLDDVVRLANELPEAQKQVLFMRIYQDMDFKDIAKSTGVSINTALGRMRYALINLRKMVTEQQ
ncbi:MAG: sigma-70 family RNA polymerase sigma factor [Paludibacteraceae bacterium]|nr:sigma-70 family RNA polymerase sigma factor [Candidatus Physcocola equi]MCQ2234030.1 sigma-70 family RNA polymerase sigma factor [Paludibacteraceae bacterium]